MIYTPDQAGEMLAFIENHARKDNPAEQMLVGLAKEAVRNLGWYHFDGTNGNPGEPYDASFYCTVLSRICWFWHKHDEYVDDSGRYHCGLHDDWPTFLHHLC